MKFLQSLIFISSFIYLVHSVELKTPMANNYPQIAVLGCDNNKANLFYDIERQVWVEDLDSSCVNNEQSILNFCQKAYPSLNIGNIVRLNTVLRFENWCEKLPSMNDDQPRCKPASQLEESVQPYRCLYVNSLREELTLPTHDCALNSIIGTKKCLHAEKWQQLASLNCANKSMVLNNFLMTNKWCGVSKFRGVQFICCPLKYVDNNGDYETSLDETLNEDDPIPDSVSVPKTTTVETHRKIIAMSLGSREPNWMADSNQWNTMKGYFSDDEDVNDDEEALKLSSTRKSHLTLNEHERFTKEKEEFRRKYKDQIDQLRFRWQQRQSDIQLIANTNPTQAQNEYEQSDIEFRREYDILKQTAYQERTSINELHESNLDTILNNARIEMKKKLVAAWNENPLKASTIEDALYNYVHVLLRDRIHLVNRYERLRVVDPNRIKLKRESIYERLRTIANQIDDALNQLRRNSKLQSQIQTRINTLLGEYKEVNEAAAKLVTDYINSSTAIKNRIPPLGRDEKKIYPISSASSNKIEDKNSNDDYYGTNDDYDDDDDNDDDDNDDSTTTTETINNNLNDQLDVGDSDWDVDDRTDSTINVRMDSNDNNDEQIFDNFRSLMPNNNRINRPIQRSFLTIYLPYIFGILLVLCVIFGILIMRFIIQQRRKDSYGSAYEKNYAFKEVDCCTPEEKALHALQMNGYENPTYKFFESQTPKC